MLITLKSELKLIWIFIVKIEEGFYVPNSILGHPSGTLIITRNQLTNIANRILPFNRIIYSAVSLKFVDSNS